MNNEKYKSLSKKTKDYLVKVVIDNDREFDAMSQDRSHFKNRAEAAERRLELVQKMAIFAFISFSKISAP